MSRKNAKNTIRPVNIWKPGDSLRRINIGAPMQAPCAAQCGNLSTLLMWVRRLSDEGTDFRTLKMYYCFMCSPPETHTFMRQTELRSELGPPEGRPWRRNFSILEIDISVADESGYCAESGCPFKTCFEVFVDQDPRGRLPMVTRKYCPTHLPAPVSHYIACVHQKPPEVQPKKYDIKAAIMEMQQKRSA